MSSKFTLLGRKLGHSLSPEIHSLLGDYSYTLSPVEPECLSDFFSSSEFSGFNVTIPYKVNAYNACDILSDEAKQIGSVNTCIRMPDGKLSGYNTDYFGFGNMCRTCGIDFGGSKVLILGSGGSSLMVQAYARNNNASRITVVSRSGPVNYSNIADFRGSDIIVNTTPVGMYPETGISPISFENFNSCRYAIDLIYNPERTAFIQDAQKHGIKTVGGLKMLVAQAAASSELFTGKPVDPDSYDEICRRISADQSNICLIGMPGCGKTTAGKLLSLKLNRPFIDTDEEIEKSGVKISDIFKNCGEAEFRRQEGYIIDKYCKEHGQVISTGGGAILSEKNRIAIRENSKVIYLIRDISELSTSNRPLSPDENSNRAIFEQRRNLYESTKDAAVQVSDDPEITAERILSCISSL